MVVDANTGKVLHNEDGDELRYPASLTKMMTLYMTFELIDAGRLSYDDRILISARAASAQPSKLGLEPGDTIRVLDAVKALVTKSANDVAIAIAEKIGGSEAAFARLMTARARELGMTRTVFRNASGLPDPDQVTTARDMITLGIRLQDQFPQHYRHFSTRQFAFGRKQYRNHNTMLASFNGIDGIKTGYTAKSGFNLVTSVRRDGRHVVAAVFGGASAATRNGEMRVLLLQALPKASTEKTRTPQLIAKLRQKPALVAASTAGPSIKTRGLGRKRETVEAQAWASDVRVAAAEPAAEIEAVRAPPVRQKAAVQMFKVRRVSVLDPQPAQAAGQQPVRRPRLLAASADAPAFAAGDEGSAGATPPVEPARNLANAEFAVMTGTPPAREPTMEDLIAATATVDPAPPVVRTAAVETTGSLADTGVARGMPPSTFEAQARVLDRPSARTYARIEPAVAAASSAVAGGPYAIQIGAFGSPAEAARRLDAVLQVADGRLAGHPPATLPVNKGSKQFYRARFRAFEQADATQTCAFLRSRQIDCLVLAND